MIQNLFNQEALINVIIIVSDHTFKITNTNRQRFFHKIPLKGNTGLCFQHSNIIPAAVKIDVVAEPCDHRGIVEA
jgi:hypothetical protein